MNESEQQRKPKGLRSFLRKALAILFIILILTGQFWFTAKLVGTESSWPTWTQPVLLFVVVCTLVCGFSLMVIDVMAMIKNRSHQSEL